LLILASCRTLKGQTDIHATYWLRYSLQLNLSESIYWSNEIDNRRFINPGSEQQFITHSVFHCRKNRWDLGAGITLSWMYSAKAKDLVTHATMEVRPAAEANYEIPLKKWSLQQRFRIDNRFIEQNKLEDVFEGSVYVMRFRYRVQAKIPIRKDGVATGSSIRLADEIMLNDRKNTFDQNRVYFTFERPVGKRISLEAGYVFIYQQRLGKKEFQERHVMRFSIIHRIGLPKRNS
jgi:hypothetical protein